MKEEQSLFGHLFEIESTQVLQHSSQSNRKQERHLTGLCTTF
jgi:hypothetical protein